ncbi:hypothetical protein TRFO_26129 [Tritrichomonas foetus]|uniref:SANT domain-containing protein n=1 Tax=Tritrichomonas foetus TaxID=1144522 RepID=A0A1J4K3F6_9EUKA|nr:hypothetical protein TRFO_26129 [Tritrichomonas foetus]|eukprot:OHT05977.1 hypothetical protein TRFO_26129 [Tritrichomonas foetus]
MKDNKKHITQSHINSQVPSKIKYQRIFDLPQYQDMFSIHDENLSVFYSTIFGFQFLNYSKKQELVQKYMKYQKNNTELLEPAVDSINLREHKDETYWGDEQVPESTVPFEGPLSIVGVSNDVEQHYSNEYDFLSFNDKNCFVEDPEREHLIYKRRNYWTEQDKNKFYELFMEIPHQFRKISEHFPGKNTKDMIEFYYMTKTTFDFDSFRAATMDKKQLAARKKKVITEGPIKRH